MPESNSNICILLSLFRLNRLLVLPTGNSRTDYPQQEVSASLARRAINAISLLIFFKAVTNVAFKLILLHVLAHRHIESQHGIFSPILLHCFDEKPLEQVLTSLEISLESRYKLPLLRNVPLS